MNIFKKKSVVLERLERIEKKLIRMCNHHKQELLDYSAELEAVRLAIKEVKKNA